MVCERISGCALFKQFTLKSSLKVWSTYYCEGEPSRCERYKLVLAKAPVPANLLPNGKMLGVPLDQLEAKHLGT
jgi:hypothetical protein